MWLVVICIFVDIYICLFMAALLNLETIILFWFTFQQQHYLQKALRGRWEKKSGDSIWRKINVLSNIKFMGYWYTASPAQREYKTTLTSANTFSLQLFLQIANMFHRCFLKPFGKMCFCERCDNSLEKTKKMDHQNSFSLLPLRISLKHSTQANAWHRGPAALVETNHGKRHSLNVRSD